ncbi:NmrA family NAD(P)-binding protein [Haloactinomyces albus]|uniref:Uncharacterized protein YbjT (DUF2867 family) n=1 Tax=Haloactinomyces albus TaxID=1352928 RepID=A0AAE4CLR6_9ACTN|nr:NAD(P)H-binding protein [Haloactinomyces albus]MDR7301616.1 uncharacterized protein YbjT (DUF2867 family) [Haloactinomyces albus]
MTILLLGATGTIGPHVVAGLRARDAEIRVLARDAARARGVLGADVDVREGDPGDDETIASAAHGAETVFLLSEHSHDMTDLQLRVIRALRRLGPRIVKLSGTSSAINPDGPYTCRQHWEIEQVLAASGQPWTVIRPNAFMQTLIGGIMLPAVQATGSIPNAIGSAGISLIDGRDVGEVCAEVLLDSSWQNETLVLTGPRSVTFAEIAAWVSEETGRDVGPTEITPADVRENLLTRGMAGWEAEHFEEMYQIFRNGQSEFVAGDVERVLGKPPRTVEDYLHEHRDTLLATAAAGSR